MDQNIITLIVGLAGLFTTLLSSFAGLYFTNKTRNDKVREILYVKQMEIIIRISEFLGELLDKSEEMEEEEVGEEKDEIYNDLIDSIEDFGKYFRTEGIFLPSDLYYEIQINGEKISEFLDNYYYDRNTKESLVVFRASCEKLYLLIHTFVGIDELSNESMKLMSTRRKFKKAVNTKDKDYRELVEDDESEN